MPSALSPRFSFHLISCLAKGTFSLAYLSLLILRIPEPSFSGRMARPLHRGLCVCKVWITQWQDGVWDGRGYWLLPFPEKLLPSFLLKKILPSKTCESFIRLSVCFWPQRRPGKPCSCFLAHLCCSRALQGLAPLQEPSPEFSFEPSAEIGVCENTEG